MPLTASAITTYFRVSDGVRVRYADTKADSKADSDVTVLLLAPWPETLWAFRRLDRVSAIGRWSPSTCRDRAIPMVARAIAPDAREPSWPAR